MLTHGIALPCVTSPLRASRLNSAGELVTIMKDFLLKYSTQALLTILVAIGGYIYSEVRETSKALSAQSAVLSAASVRFENQAVALAELKVAIDSIAKTNAAQDIRIAEIRLNLKNHLSTVKPSKPAPAQEDEEP